MIGARGTFGELALAVTTFVVFLAVAVFTGGGIWRALAVGAAGACLGSMALVGLRQLGWRPPNDNE